MALEKWFILEGTPLKPQTALVNITYLFSPSLVTMVTMFNEKHLCEFKLDIAYFVTSGACLEIRLKYLKINK